MVLSVEDEAIIITYAGNGTEPLIPFMSLFDVACRRPWLIATFREPQRMASWALNRPGIVEARRVAWLEVENSELAGAGDVAAWFVSRLANASLTDAVGLITARNVGSHLRSLVRVENIVAECLITLGLNNGERAGRRVFSHLHPLNAGTINLLCAVSVPLTGAALLEAASVATQASRRKTRHSPAPERSRPRSPCRYP
jgi:adenosylcobinamide amidohydrolase